MVVRFPSLGSSRRVVVAVVVVVGLLLRNCTISTSEGLLSSLRSFGSFPTPLCTFSNKIRILSIFEFLINNILY